MTLSDISIRRPVFAWMLMSMLMVFGAISMGRLGVSQLPAFTYPVLTINVSWPGAAPELMETEIVNRIEEAVISVEGIKNIQSTMRQGMAQVKVEFQFERNIDAALQETNAKLRSVALPAGVEAPTIVKMNQDDNPIMWLAVTSTRPFHELVEYIDLNLRDKFQIVPGVGNMVLGGWSDRNLRVWVDLDKLNAYELTILDVKKTLQNQHLLVAGGVLENSDGELNVRIMGEGATVEEIGNLPISERGGEKVYRSKIRIKDVARVEDGVNDIRRISRSNSITSVGLGIQKQRGYNEVEVGNNVKALMEQLNREMPQDIRIHVSYDGTKFTEEAIRETEFTLILSILVTGLVCWAFLGSWRSTFNVLLSIPTSVLGTFIVMYFMDFTLNFFTLLALSLAIGLVVDDAILVLENIVRHFHMGKSSREAALDGAREITFAATASTVAVMAIFLPVLLISGVIGKMLFQFGMTLCTAVGLSLLEAITLTPVRCAQFMTAKEDESRFAVWINSRFSRAAAQYGRVLDFCLRHRWKIISSSAFLFVLSLGLVYFIRFEFSPSQDAGILIIRFETPVGSSLQFTSDRLRRVEEELKKLPYVRLYFVNAGGLGGGEINSGIGFISMVPKNQRSVNQIQIMNELRERLKNIPDLKCTVIDPTTGGFSTKRGANIELSLKGPQYRVLKEKSGELVKKFAESGLMTDLDTDYKEGAPEVRVIPDREKAAVSNVSMQAITETISTAMGGERAGKYTNGQRRYDLRLRLQPEQWQSEEDIKKLKVRTTYGELIPLSDVVRIETVPTLLSITRENRERAITIYANVKHGESLDKALKFAADTAAAVLPEGYVLNSTGSSETAKESMKSFVFALGMGFLIAYMILGAQFNSFIHPFTVLLSLFFTLTGSLLALFLTNLSFNMYSAIGILLLMGIVKKNSILLVEFFNKKRESGLSLKDAILVGGPIRLRPIVMTTTATVASAIPPALGLGPGAEVRVPLAVTVIGGVIVSCMFTLVVVPCVYSLLARWDSLPVDEHRPAPELELTKP